MKRKLLKLLKEKQLAANKTGDTYQSYGYSAQIKLLIDLIEELDIEAAARKESRKSRLEMKQRLGI